MHTPSGYITKTRKERTNKMRNISSIIINLREPSESDDYDLADGPPKPSANRTIRVEKLA